MYRMKVTTSLLVTEAATNVEDVHELISIKYKLMYDISLQGNVYRLLNEAKIKISNSSLIYREERFTITSPEEALTFYEKVFRPANLLQSETKPRILALEFLLENMSCFTIQKPLGRSWASVGFYHPFHVRMKSFTQTVIESGLFSLFKDVVDNFKQIHFELHYRDMFLRRDIENIRKSFIRFEETKSIFILIFGSYFLIGIVFVCIVFKISREI